MDDADWTDGVVVALFPDRARAERGIRALHHAGFSRAQIGGRSGGMLVTVSAGARADDARRILAENDADVGPAPATEAPAHDRRQPQNSGRRRTDVRSAYPG